MILSKNIALAAAFFCASVHAELITEFVDWQGHRYGMLSRSTWTEAAAEAAILGGHLVIVNSKEENDFLVQNFFVRESSVYNLWLGARRSEADPKVWEWTDASPVEFTDWQKGEPNYNEGAEKFAGLWSGFLGGKIGWNDFADDPGFGLHGVVELSE